MSRPLRSLSCGAAWFRLAALALLLSISNSAFAADKPKPEEKKAGPPKVIVALPLAVTAGTTNRVRVRGQDLAEATEVRFTNANDLVRIMSKSKLDLPKDADARKVGDTQIELELYFPPVSARGTNYFTVTTSLGTSAPHPLLLMPAGALTEEQEPNGGFERAQSVISGTILHGVVREEADVDVFRFEGQAGQWLVVEVSAARLGSALDPVLTLHGAGGFILAESDDSPGHRDAQLRYRLPAERGRYYLSLVDALNRGGPAFAYLLSVKLE